ncbi:MAG: hypothetical protein ABI234_11285 [Ktedonobacteraceae bacterium]
MVDLSTSERIQKLKTTSRTVQGILYMLAAVPHFVAVDTELKLIPSFLPWRRAALYITGIFEFLGGLGLLVPRLRKPASWGLAALLVAIWPANIYHAILDKQSGRWPKTRIYHIIRFPLQIVLIVWVLWAGKDERSAE